MLVRLSRHGVSVQSEQHLIDKWFAPTTLHDQAHHDRWFDNDHGIAYRIRTVVTPDGTPASVTLDSKQHTAANDHNTFKETVLPYDTEAAMLDFLQAQGYYNWLTIDKLRRTFASPQPNISIVLDSIAGVKEALGLNAVLELEYAGSAPREEALAILDDFARSLGFSANDLFAKSLTVEAMRVLARFQ